MKYFFVFLFVFFILACGTESVPKENHVADSSATHSISYPLPSSVDSLSDLLEIVHGDSNEINVLLSWSKKIMNNNPDTAIIMSQRAFEVAEKLAHSPDSSTARSGKIGMANAMGSIGVCYRIKGDFVKALEQYFKALKIDEGLQDTGRIATRLGNIGVAYDAQGNQPKALEYYLKALALDEKLGNKAGIARHLGNIGNLYSVGSDYPKALEFYQRALKLATEIKDKNGIATDLGNIGNAYYSHAKHVAQGSDEQKDLLEQALENYLLALKARKELGNKKLIAATMGNIGSVYKTKAENLGVTSADGRQMNDTALDYYFNSLKMRQQIRAQDMISGMLGNIGNLYINIGKYKEAADYIYRSLAISDSIGAKVFVKEAYEGLSRLYEHSTVSLPDSVNGPLLNAEQMRTKSIYFFKRFVDVRDRLFNEENKKQLVRKEMNYEFDKKEAVTKAENDKKEVLAKEELKQKEIQRNYFIGGFGLVLILGGFIFRSYRQKQKANEIISHQKAIVEEKQKEILDSIHYAKRIQKSLLPREFYIQKNVTRLKDLK